MRYLPQNNRNFLNFAALAPGVRVSTDEFRQEVSGGSLASRNTNVFIDGVSYKNDVIEGGVIGQDASRGNPFPQNAVQEFQVADAELQGGVREGFERDHQRGDQERRQPVLRRLLQPLSGQAPRRERGDRTRRERIARSRARPSRSRSTSDGSGARRWAGRSSGTERSSSASYEENRQDRASQVILGSVSNAPPALLDALRTFEGTFTSPFRERLLFAKGTYQPAPGQAAEVTYNWRNETDIRGFGNWSTRRGRASRRRRTCATAWTRCSANTRSPAASG